LEPQLSAIKKVEFNRVYQFHPQNLNISSAVSAPDWGQKMIGTQEVWLRGVLGAGVKIAVIDSYVDVTHPQIKNNIDVNTFEIPNNGLDDDVNGVVDDDLGAKFLEFSNSPSPSHSEHGTHVSGIIAGCA
jgi:subtilisin family serine protease